MGRAVPGSEPGRPLQFTDRCRQCTGRGKGFPERDEKFRRVWRQVSGFSQGVDGFRRPTQRQQHATMREPRHHAAASLRDQPFASAQGFLAPAGNDHLHGLADRIEEPVIIGGRRCHQPLSVHLPLFSTTTSRSLTLERNETTDPSFHISVTMVSPGNTGDEKRTSNPVISVWS